MGEFFVTSSSRLDLEVIWTRIHSRNVFNLRQYEISLFANFSQLNFAFHRIKDGLSLFDKIFGKFWRRFALSECFRVYVLSYFNFVIIAFHIFTVFFLGDVVTSLGQKVDYGFPQIIFDCKTNKMIQICLQMSK